jgi:threonine aldolase
MDGARLWNASAASGILEREYAVLCDSVAVCFSKGLGAPVGSALAGPADFIARGRRFRKMLGGGMRQAGILAAAALHALRHHRQRLVDDHANARALAEGLSRIDGVEIDLASVETNIVRFRTPGIDANAMVEQLRMSGLLLLSAGVDGYRAVTHLQVSAADVAQALKIIATTVVKARDVLKSPAIP